MFFALITRHLSLVTRSARLGMARHISGQITNRLSLIAAKRIMTNARYKFRPKLRPFGVQGLAGRGRTRRFVRYPNRPEARGTK